MLASGSWTSVEATSNIDFQLGEFSAPETNGKQCQGSHYEVKDRTVVNLTFS